LVLKNVLHRSLIVIIIITYLWCTMQIRSRDDRKITDFLTKHPALYQVLKSSQRLFIKDTLLKSIIILLAIFI